MAEKTDPCEKGLTPECFAERPVYAKRMFAYRLFCLLAPWEITKRLQKYLLDKIPDIVPPIIIRPPFPPLPPWIPPPGGGTTTTPPTEEPVEVRIYATLSNGYVVSRANNWSDARNGNDYLNAITDEYTDGSAIAAYLEGALYYVKRAFLYFDLSTIESLSKVTSAILSVVGAENAESSVRVYKGTQEDPLVTTDFGAYEGYPLSLCDWQYYIDPDLNRNLMTLSTAGKTHVKDSWPGTVKFCLREDTKDRANEAPDSLGPLNGMYWAKWPDLEFDPYLDLIYT